MPFEAHVTTTAGDPVGAIDDRVRPLFVSARGSHAWDHTQRVGRLCRRLGPAEGADMPVLLIAALLHDIGRCQQDRTRGATCHARAGVRLARPLIAPLAMTDARKDNILHCIASHRFRGRTAPATIEAKVLFDADKLDAIGAVGVARAYLFAGEVGARLHVEPQRALAARAYSSEDTGFREYQVKLRHIRERLLTPSGRALAQERHAFMEAFFTRFLAEIQGER